MSRPRGLPGGRRSPAFAFAFLSVAAVVACLFPGLSAQAQDPLALPQPPTTLAFVSERLTSATLPAATGGTPPYTYSASSPSLSTDGLSFDSDTRVLSGTVPDSSQWTDSLLTCAGGVPCLTRNFDYTVTDSDGNTATRQGEYTAIDFPVGFLPTPDDLHFAPDTAIPPVTLQPTSDISFTYALTGLPPGLSFAAGTRVLSGTPTEEGTTTVTYTATHTYFTPTVTHTVTFDITVTALALTVPPATLTFVSERLTSATLPEATGGTPPYTYSVRVNSSDPLSFAADTRVLSGTIPDSSQWNVSPAQCVGDVPCLTRTLDYTVTDSGGTTVTSRGEYRIIDFPAGFLPTPDDLHFTPDTAIPPVTLQPTSDSSFTYALTGLPPGLSFAADTRILSGTPTEEGTTTLTYTASGAHYTPTITHTVTFAITVGELALPSWSASTFVTDRPTSVTLPAATGGTSPHTYALTGPNGAEVSEAVPGLSFAADTRILSGTPTEEGTTTLTYTITDSAATPARVTRTFSVIIVGELVLPAPDDLAWPAGTAIDPVTLPAATGGLPPHTYALTGPNGVDLSEAVPGLSFAAATRVLSGTPTEEGTATLTYTVTDRATTPVRVTRTFSVTVTVESIPTALNEILLPEVARAMAGSTVGAIARRIGQAARRAAGPEAAGLRLGGRGGWAAALRTHGEAVSEGRRGVKELLAGSDFVLPLSASADRAVGASSLALWGSGEYRGLSGESGTLEWDGELVGVHLGVDARPREDLLAGVAVSWLESDLDYEDAAGDGDLGEGAHAVETTGVHPYLGWRAGERLEVWATAGYGEGELKVTPKGRERRASDVETRTVGVGGSGLVLERGASTVRLRGEVMHGTLEVDDSAHIEGLKMKATRVRMTVEAGRTRALANGGVFEPSLEVGVRHDGGDGETGTGAEVGARLSWRDPARGITAEGRVHALVAGYDGDYEEWGIEGHFGVSPGAGGRGLSLSLRPGYGESGGDGVRRLWRQEAPEEGDRRAEDYRARLEARLGYGLFWPGYAGVFTPYTGMTVGATDGYRIGVNWKAGPRFDLDLRGERREPGGAGPAEHALLLEGEVRF